jgi:hypothetical protein
MATFIIDGAVAVRRPIPVRHNDPHVHFVRRGRMVEIHSEPPNRWTGTGREQQSAKHEAGHVAVGEGVGWKFAEARIFPGGGGVTRFHTTSDDPIEDIAVSAAGWRATGTKDGCGSDFGFIDRAKRRLPPDERDRGYHKGINRCDSILSWTGGKRRRIAKQLVETGRYS